MVDCGFDMPNEVLAILATVAMIASEVAVSVPGSYVKDVRAGVMIDMLTGTAISAMPVNAKNVFAGADSKVRAATRTALGSMSMLASLEEALAIGSGASSCWPATA